MALSVLSQTITQKGVTYRYNGKNPRTPIGGVYIKPVTADNGVVSDSSTGSFHLVLKNLTMGGRIGNVKVTKQGMMVFNKMTVDEWSVRKEPLCLILCDVNEFQKQKKNLIAIGEREAKKKYDKKLAEFKMKNEAQQLKIVDYYNKLDSLEQEYLNALKHMDEYADVFARIDESAIDTLVQRAVELFNRGETEKSIRMLEKGNYMEKLYDALRTKSQAQELRHVADSAEVLADKDIDEYVKAIKVQISQYKLVNDYENAGTLLKGLADRLNSLEAIAEYIDYCSNQNEFKENESYSQKMIGMLENTQRPDKEQLLVNVYNHLASLYIKTNRLEKSEDIYKVVISKCECLAKENPKVYEPYLLQLYNNLAILYDNAMRFDKSEEMYIASLGICIRLAKENPKIYESKLAQSCNNLAVLYYKINSLNESEEMYRMSLGIRERLAKENPKAYEPELAQSYNNLARLYGDTKRFDESEKMYRASLNIRERLVKENMKAYEPELAQSYGNLANLYCDIQRFVESEEMYKAAKVIYERLVKENSNVYEPELAHLYSDLAVLYDSTNRFNESEEMYRASLDIYEHLAKENPKVYEPIWAGSCIDLAILYNKKQRFHEGAKMYKVAIRIYECLAKENPNDYEPTLAALYNIVADLYGSIQHFKESEEMYKAAIVIYERLSKENPKEYEPKLAALYNVLANLYGSTQHFKESENMFKAAVAMYEYLYERNPQQYQKDLSLGYYYLGISMVDNKNKHNAIAVFERSLKLYKDIKEETVCRFYIKVLSLLVDLYGNDKNYVKAYTYNEELLSVIKVYFEENSEEWKTDYCVNLVNLSFYANLTGNFKESGQLSLEALKIDSTNHVAYINLAAALLFQGKVEESEKIYRQYKKEFKDFFLSDFAEYERLQVIPKEYIADIERIKKMLKE